MVSLYPPLSIQDPIVFSTPPNELEVGLCLADGSELKAGGYARVCLGDWNSKATFCATENWPEVTGWLLFRAGVLVWRSPQNLVPPRTLRAMDMLNIMVNIELNGVPIAELQKKFFAASKPKEPEPEEPPLPPGTKRIVEM